MIVLVTGANSQLGRELRLAGRGASSCFIFTDISSVPGEETVYMDITNTETVRLMAESEKADIIVNCAAYTDVEKAEDDPDFARTLNADAVEGLAQVARERDATLIHLSTDYIFAGDGTEPIGEDSPPGPLSVYGATKLAGEKAVRDSGCKAIVIRTSWLYSPFGRNFVKTIRAKARETGRLTVVSDQVGSPTSAADLASFIVHIIESGQAGKTGTYNYSGEGETSWYGFAREICSLSGIPCSISPCTSSELRTRARRPLYSVLDKSLACRTFGVTIPFWKDSLKECISRIEQYG